MRILLSLILVLAGLGAQAQITLRGYFGINNTKLTENFNDASWRSKLGYQAGADLLIGTRVFLQTGLQWELVNSTLEPTDPSLDDAFNFSASHIRVPLMIGFRLIDPDVSSMFNIRVFTGPDAAFVLNSEESFFNNIQFNKDALKGANFGYTVGAGVDILFLFADVGYRWGISRIWEQESVQNGSRTNIFYANVGIKLGL